MKRLLLTLLILCVVLSGCSNPGKKNQAIIEIKDAFDRDIMLTKYPEKILIAGKQTPMIANFFYMFESASEKINAIENRNQSNDQYLNLIDPDIETKYILEKGAGAEQIAPLEPDLVILKTTMRESVGLSIERLEIPVVYVELETLDQIYRDLRNIAVILNEENRGEYLVKQYQEFTKSIEEKIKNKLESKKPVVLVTRVENLDGEYIFSVPSSKWLQTLMIEDLDALPVWKEATPAGGWSEVNIEQILKWNPDFVFVINYQGDAPEIIDSINQDELWENLNAAIKKNIFSFPYDFISWDQPDPRWILGYSFLAWSLYPELFDDEFFLEIIRDFHLEFFNLDTSTFEDQILSRINNYLD